MTTSADVAGWTAGVDDMVERIAGHDLQRYVGEQFGDGDAVLVPDETGYLNKGDTSAGVGRQHSGTAGRIDNGQTGVFLGSASRHGRVLLDRALHLPEDWAQNRRQRARVRIPDEVAFITRPMLGLAMLERARAAGGPSPGSPATALTPSASGRSNTDTVTSRPSRCASTWVSSRSRPGSQGSATRIGSA